MAGRTTLDKRIDELESQVEALSREVAHLQEEPKTVALRTIRRDDAKGEILDLFRTGRTLYYSDIVQELGIDIDLVVELCEELESEGRVETIGRSEGARRSPRRRKNLSRSKTNPEIASG